MTGRFSVRIGLHLLALCAALLAPLSALAEEPSILDETTLTGNWGGLRSKLVEQGYSWEFTHRSDILSVIGGGTRRGTALPSYTDARLLLDLSKLYGWSNTNVFIQYNSALGGKPNGYSGSFMGVDSIETRTNTSQLYQAWLQKNWFNESLSALFGLYPIDSEFYVTDSSGIFIHPSLGLAAEIAQSGVNGPPAYPLASLGTRIKYSSPNRTAYMQAALLDGAPGDPNNPYGTQIHLRKGDGSFLIVELGYTPLEAGHTFEPVLPEGVVKIEPGLKLHERMEAIDKTAIGFWRYSRKFPDLTDTDPTGQPIPRKSYGLYLLAERSLFIDEQQPGQGLAAFVRLGLAAPDIHTSDWSASSGFRYKGPIQGRDDDSAGIAFTYSHASAKYRRITPQSDHEIAIETAYRAQIKPWLAIQPLAQHIISPGMNRRTPNATLIGIRLEALL